MSIRKKFISLTSPFSSVLPLNMLSALTGHHFIIPFYHIISDEECPHVSQLYRFKGTKAFEKDIDYLATNYYPIGATDLPDVLAGKYKGKKIMLLTFDDGLRQMSEVVAPILLRKGIPAIFFVNTDFIDNKELMFRYKVSLIIQFGKFPPDVVSMFRTVRSAEALHEILGSAPDTFESFRKKYKPYMTSEQIRSLISDGFAIGSHSRSHPYYEDISIDQQLSETLDSMNVLQRDFGLTQKLFAFPFTDYGVSSAFFEKVFDEGKLDFTFGGAGIKNDVHPRQYQRIPMEGWDASAEQTLKSEYLYYLLRAPFGKNTIQRK